MPEFAPIVTTLSSVDRDDDPSSLKDLRDGILRGELTINMKRTRDTATALLPAPSLPLHLLPLHLHLQHPASALLVVLVVTLISLAGLLILNLLLRGGQF